MFATSDRLLGRTLEHRVATGPDRRSRLLSKASSGLYAFTSTHVDPQPLRVIAATAFPFVVAAGASADGEG